MVASQLEYGEHGPVRAPGNSSGGDQVQQGCSPAT